MIPKDLRAKCAPAARRMISSILVPLALLLLTCVSVCRAQAAPSDPRDLSKPDAPIPSHAAVPVCQNQNHSQKAEDVNRCRDCAAPKSPHRFWDRQNDWLFAGVGASRTLDYFSTLNMRRRGRQEILLTNDAVDNHAAFAAIEVAATGVSIGASYLFHRYDHHKLERWTSFIHIGLATTGAVRNYSLKTAHVAPAPASP